MMSQCSRSSLPTQVRPGGAASKRTGPRGPSNAWSSWRATATNCSGATKRWPGRQRSHSSSCQKTTTCRQTSPRTGRFSKSGVRRRRRRRRRLPQCVFPLSASWSCCLTISLEVQVEEPRASPTTTQAASPTRLSPRRTAVWQLMRQRTQRIVHLRWMWMRSWTSWSKILQVSASDFLHCTVNYSNIVSSITLCCVHTCSVQAGGWWRVKTGASLGFQLLIWSYWMERKMTTMNSSHEVRLLFVADDTESIHSLNIKPCCHKQPPLGDTV